MTLEFPLEEPGKEDRVSSISKQAFPLESVSIEKCFGGPQALGGVRRMES